jgi:hypothetical protein
MKNAVLSNKNNKSQNPYKRLKSLKSLTTIEKKSQNIKNIPLNNSKNSLIIQNKNSNNKISNLLFINSNKTSGNSIFSKNTSSTNTPLVMKNFEFSNSEKSIIQNKNKINESLEKNNSKNGIIKIIQKKDFEKNNNVKTNNSQSKKEINYNSNKIDFFNKEIKHLRSKSYDMDSSESLSDINIYDFSSLDLTPLPILDENDNKSTLYGAKYLRRLEYDIQINKGFRYLLERNNYYRKKKLSKYYSYLKKFVQITRKLSKKKGGIGEKIIFLRFIYRLNYECYNLNFRYFISLFKKYHPKKKNTKNNKNLKSKKNITNNNIICFENKINIIRNKNLNFSIEKNINFLYKKFKKSFQISQNININFLKNKKLFDIEKATEFEIVNNKLSIDYFNQFIKHLSNIFGENINLSGMRNFPRPICEQGKNKNILKKTYFKRIYNLENKIKLHENSLDEISQKNEQQFDLIDEEIQNKYNDNQIKNKHIKLIKKKIKNKLSFLTKIIIKNDKSKINNNLNNTNSNYENKKNIKKINNNRLIIDLLIIFINNFWLIKIKKMFFDLFLNDYYYPFKRDKNDYKRFSSKCELMDDDEEKLNKLNSYFSSKKYENNLFKK